MKPIEMYDIFTIVDEGKDYTVANMTTYNDFEYLYLIEVDKEDNLIESNQKIVKRVLKDGEDSVEQITDETELSAVAQIFYELFKKAVENPDSED